MSQYSQFKSNSLITESRGYMPLRKTVVPSHWVLLSSRVFDPQGQQLGAESSEVPSLMRKLQRTPSDEILLTELAWDDKDVSIYDITSIIMVGERANLTPFAKLKCYMDNETKEFFIEINQSTPLKAFTRSVLLNILDLAEKEGAKKLYACLRRGTENIEQFVKAFLFVGFSKLEEEELKSVSMTQTHILVQYKMEEDELL